MLQRRLFAARQELSGSIGRRTALPLQDIIATVRNFEGPVLSIERQAEPAGFASPDSGHRLHWVDTRPRSRAPLEQGSFFWLQNTEGEPLVGVFATNHQAEVLPLYFATRKKNPGGRHPLYNTQVLGFVVGSFVIWYEV